jgi:hypothetical protein
MNEHIGASFRPLVNEWMESPRGFWSFFHPSSIQTSSRLPAGSVGWLQCRYGAAATQALSLSLSSLADAAFGSARLRTDASAAAAADQLIACVSCRCAREEEEEEEEGNDLFLLIFDFFVFWFFKNWILLM